jgi:hypothetical protein
MNLLAEFDGEVASFLLRLDCLFFLEYFESLGVLQEDATWAGILLEDFFVLLFYFNLSGGRAIGGPGAT